jgi:hypothetical protein
MPKASLIRFVLLAFSVVFAFASGCQEAKVKVPNPNDKARKLAEYKNRKIATPKDFPRAQSTRPVRTNNPDVDSAVADLERSYQATRSRSFSTGKPEEVAVKKVSAAINAGLEVGPTLVVWMVDRTISASKLTTESLPSIKAFYDSPEIRAGASSGAKPLLTAVVTFDEQIDFKLDPPSVNPAEIKAALDSIQSSASGTERTFSAVQQVLDKYLTFRTEERREIVLVLITDEAGSDPELVDGLAELVRKNAIPVYTIGVAAPWGQTNPYAPATVKPTKDDSSPIHGPESRQSERVQIEQIYAGNYGAQTDYSLIESGFGPFALERLCRASGGEFLPIRPATNSSYYYRDTLGNKFWPSGSEMRFEEKSLSRYAPDYVSATEYEKLLAGNAARRVLVEAATLPPLRVDAFPETRFAKVEDARTIRQMNTAQQFAARNLPPVDQFYNKLAPGEGDRDQLTSPRLQAEFDLAWGRTLAIKVRLDGYNAMIAALKRGKSFQNPASTTWHLEHSDAVETGSALQKMAEKARFHLNRVTSEHPGTPFAKLAALELQLPLGWTWREE